MKIKKMIIELKKTDIEALTNIIALYLQSISDPKGGDFRRCVGKDASIEYIFIYEFLESLMGFPEVDNFIQKQKQRRKEHIDWLIDGDDDCGIVGPQISLPKNHEELREILIKYDMDWLGDK